jgi:VanZ family protein
LKTYSLAVIAVLAIVVLSLIPANWETRTGATPRLEHFVAYCGTSILLGLAWPGTRQALAQGLMLTVLSIAMELLQNFSPGRHPSALDALVSTLGAITGLGLALAFHRGSA